MSLILDLIILLIGGLTILLAVRNGFVKTFLSAASTLIALVIVFLFATPLTEALERSPLAEAVHTNTASYLEQLVEEQHADDSYALAADRESELYPLLESLGIDGESLSRWVSEHATLAKEQFHEELVTYIADHVTPLLLHALSVAILFFGSFFLLKLLSFLLTGVIEQIPFVRGANHFLGLVLGILLALIRVFLFCAVVRVLLDTASLSGASAFAGLDPDKTYLFRLIGSLPFLHLLS